MNQNLALEVLASVMKWDDERARKEYSWLRLMSRIKYDEYRDFLAGVRFIESLAQWLQQFDTNDRSTAYAFVRNRLIYFGPAEMTHLVELTYPETVQPHIMRMVAGKLGIPVYRVWSSPEAADEYRGMLRRTLFLGLSDGARIDIFRRTNVGIVSNEQVVVATQIDNDKWAGLLKDLRIVQGDAARFANVFLIDDFTASGNTLLRVENGQWKGKLERFWESVREKAEEYFEPNWHVIAHHYIGTSHAHAELLRRANGRRQASAHWLPAIEFTYGLVLASDVVVSADRDTAFADLIDRYYDPGIQTAALEVGGTEDVRWGFGGCALPVVIEHNTPNNSIALVWAESDGTGGHHAMRPLFRRRQRHD